jgi:hypothetical protein
MSVFLTLPIMRCAAVLTAVALLSGCASSSAEDSFAAAPRPAMAARSTSAPPIPPRTPSAMVPSVDPLIDARGECWVKLDRDRRAPKDLDQRVKLVEKCVADKMAALSSAPSQ